MENSTLMANTLAAHKSSYMNDGNLFCECGDGLMTVTDGFVDGFLEMLPGCAAGEVALIWHQVNKMEDV